MAFKLKYSSTTGIQTIRSFNIVFLMEAIESVSNAKRISLRMSVVMRVVLISILFKIARRTSPILNNPINFSSSRTTTRFKSELFITFKASIIVVFLLTIFLYLLLIFWIIVIPLIIIYLILIVK